MQRTAMVLAVAGLAATSIADTLDVRVNSYTRSDQRDAAVDLLADGSSLVVWSSKGQEAGTWGVFGQRLARDGAFEGEEFRVNLQVEGIQWRPDVASDASGAWVVWESHDDAGAASAVARRFTADEQSDELVVAEGSGIAEVSIASRDDGAAVVCWVETIEGRRVPFARFVQPDGTMGDRVTLDDSGHASNVAITRVGASFAVAWGVTDRHNKPFEVRVRSLGADGTPLGLARTVAGDGAIEPAIAADDAGRFVVTWMQPDIGGHDVLATLFDVSAQPARTWTVARSDEVAWASGTDVAMASDGRFVIAYNRFDRDMPEGLPEDVSSRRPMHDARIIAHWYTAEGVETRQAQVNGYDEGPQAIGIDRAASRLAWGDDDALIFAWDGSTPGDAKGVGVTYMGPQGLALASHEGVARVAASVEVDTPPEPNPEQPTPLERNVRGNGPDFGFAAFAGGLWYPPDPDLAVGPDHIVAAVNSSIAFFTKDGTQTYNNSLSGGSGFFGSIGAGSFIFDPVALYDVHTDRYVVMCAESDHREGQVFAISDDDNPNGNWNQTFFNTETLVNNALADFPNLGIDEDAIYVASDLFGGSITNYITIINKAEFLAGNSPSINTVRTSGSFQSLGATYNYDENSPAAYFVTAHAGSTFLRIRGIQDPNGSPTMETVDVSVPQFSQPSDAPQLGSSNRVSTVDKRIKNGVVRDGQLWISHNVIPAGQSRTMVRWYQIDLRGWPDSGNSPSLVQWGNVDLGNGIYTWFPDISVDAEGNVGLVYARSSSSEYTSVNRAFRRSTDFPGTLRGHEIMKSSSSPETGSRWGDYFSLHEDPACPGKFWGHGEYRTSNHRTWVGSFHGDHPADANIDGVVDIFDVFAFLDLFDVQDPEADINGDGEWDIFDVLTFLAAFGNDCV